MPERLTLCDGGRLVGCGEALMMGEYFKPLRRKVGVATLLFSCALAGVWVVVPESEFEDESVGLDFTISVEATGFGIEWQGFSSTFGGSRDFKWLIPYWSVVLPLTLLSAYLLLSKPRLKTAKPPNPAASQ